jgi:hypothetical protein
LHTIGVAPTLGAVWLQGLIIDPYNELSSSTDNVSDGRMEHQRVNDLMAELRAFAKKQQVGLDGCWTAGVRLAIAC